MYCLESQDFLIASINYKSCRILATCQLQNCTFQLEPVVIEICEPRAFGTLKPTSPPRTFRRVVRKSNPTTVLGLIPATNSYARFAQVRGYPVIQAFALCEPMLGLIPMHTDYHPPLLFKPDFSGTYFRNEENGREEIITIHSEDQNWLVWRNATEQDLITILLNACGKILPTDLVRHVIITFCFLPSSRFLKYM